MNLSLQYPAFDRTEWNFLNSDLSIVGKAVALQVSDQNIQSLLLAKQHLVVRISVEGTAVLDQIMNEARARSSFDKNTEQRREILADLLEGYRNAKKAPYQTAGTRSQMQSIVDEILSHYSPFAADTFREDFATLVSKEEKYGESAKKELQRVNGKITHETIKRRELLSSVKESCKRGVLPAYFRGRRIDTSLEGKDRERSEQEMAEYILRTFLSDWQSRVVFFNRPVSIYGTAIHTMPPRRRDIWMRAFRELKLADRLGKRVVYQWVHSNEPDVPEAVSEAAFISVNNGESTDEDE